MTPFSTFLIKFRQERGLRQNQMASLLGVEQSYLSALESGQKPPPRKVKLDYIAQKLELNETQTQDLALAAKISEKTIKIPKTVKLQTQEMCHLFQMVLPQISDKQVQIIRLALELSQCEEAPKM